MMNDFSVDMNEYLPLRDVVFNTLRKAILKGELKPGERLMEIALAERLGVSRTPVREAMRKLELEGLVVMIPRRGAQVANITEKDLNDVLEVRIALENLSIENACTRMTEEQLEELQRRMTGLDAERAAILEESRQQGEAIKASLIAAAHAEAERIREQAARAAANETKGMLEELRARMADEIMTEVEEALKGRLNGKMHARLIDKSLKKVVLN